MISGLKVVYDEADLAKAGASAIREVDGRLSAEEGRRVAIAVLESVGMESKETPAIAPPAEDLPEARG